MHDDPKFFLSEEFSTAVFSGALQAYQEQKNKREAPIRYIPTGRPATPNMLSKLKRRIENKYHRA